MGRGTGFRGAGLALAALIAATTVIACSTTKVTQTEKRPLGRTKLEKWTVLAVTDSLQTRMRYERVMARKLQAEGVYAMAAVDLFGTGRIDREEVERKVAAGVIDAGLVTTVVSSEREREYLSARPPGLAPTVVGGGGFYSDYDRSFDLVWTPGYTLERDVLRLDTKLYDLTTEREVWSLASKSFDPSNVEKLIDEVSKTVIKQLRKDRLIP